MTELRFVPEDHDRLHAHLFPGDGFEAAAILVCARSGRTGQILLVKDVILVPYEECAIRTEVRLKWSGEYLEKAVEIADAYGGAIILMHSHPGGLFSFSDIDNASDAETIPVLQMGVSDTTAQHGSAIMTPDGQILCRLYNRDMSSAICRRVWSMGHDILDRSRHPDERPMAYTGMMTKDLRDHTAVIVGVSGTGSIVATMLGHLGVGRIILVDFDRIEARNLNRILNATPADIGRYKTHVLRDAILTLDPNIAVETAETKVDAIAAIELASEGTILFSCVDSMEGRYFCDLMVESFLCPLIDLGVMIPTRCRNDQAQVADICGRIDYVRPGGVSLWERGEITGEGLSAEYIRQTNPEEHAQQIEEGYIQGVPEEAPSVISLNMRAASTAVHEWLSRLYAIRHQPNQQFTQTYFSLAAPEEEYSAETDLGRPIRSEMFARGLSEPLLGCVYRDTGERSAA